MKWKLLLLVTLGILAVPPHAEANNGPDEANPLLSKMNKKHDPDRFAVVEKIFKDLRIDGDLSTGQHSEAGAALYTLRDLYVSLVAQGFERRNSQLWTAKEYEILTKNGVIGGNEEEKLSVATLSPDGQYLYEEIFTRSSPAGASGSDEVRVLWKLKVVPSQGFARVKFQLFRFKVDFKFSDRSSIGGSGFSSTSGG